METVERGTTFEVWHADFNLDRKDNLNELPAEKSVYGVFAIVDGKPINCRYVGETENLRVAIKELFENPPGEGLKKFMQGPWIPMVQFELMPNSSAEARQALAKTWEDLYDPKIDEDGEYPGYYGK